MDKVYAVSYDDIKEAAEYLKDVVHRTPVLTSTRLNQLSGYQIHFKCELFQKTGSFKFRNAYNAVRKIKEEGKGQQTIVLSSSGNAGRALATSCHLFSVPCHIAIGQSVSTRDAIINHGGMVTQCQEQDSFRSAAAKQVAMETGGRLFGTSDDPNSIAGSGTIAIEFLEQVPNLDVIIASVAGGSLISGIAVAAKQIKPTIKIVAAEPALGDDCSQSKLNNRLMPITKDPDTIADALRSNITQTTWPIIRDLVDHVVTVSEDEIKYATRLVWEVMKLTIEPSAGVSVALLLDNKLSDIVDPGASIGVVLCGGNVNLDQLGWLSR